MTRLEPRHAVLLAAVAFIWGLNFIPIRWALDEIPPFALASLRFLFASVPAVFFVRRPTLPAITIVAYGLLIGVLQFGFLFLAIHSGLAAGLASLLMQMQMFFTVGLAAIFTGDRVSRRHAEGALIAVLGVLLLVYVQVTAGATATLLGLVMIAIAAFGWAAGNVVAKAARQRQEFDLFSLTVWSSLASPLPLAAMSLSLDPAPLDSIRAAGPVAWGRILFMAWAATLFGYSTWNRLLHRYPASLVSQFTMLIPVVGLAGGYFVLDESLDILEVASAVIILLGVAYAMGGTGPRAVAAAPVVGETGATAAIATPHPA